MAGLAEGRLAGASSELTMADSEGTRRGPGGGADHPTGGQAGGRAEGASGGAPGRRAGSFLISRINLCMPLGRAR